MKKNSLFCFVTFIVLECISFGLLLVAAFSPIGDDIRNPIKYQALMLLALQIIVFVLALLKKNVKGALIANGAITVYFVAKLSNTSFFTEIYNSVLALLIFVAFIVCTVLMDKKWASIVCVVILCLYAYEAYFYFDDLMTSLNQLIGSATTEVVNVAFVNTEFAAAAILAFLGNALIFGDNLLIKKEKEETKKNTVTEDVTEEN